VTIAPHSVVVVDPGRNEVVDDIAGVGSLVDLTSGGGALWGANRDDNTVVRIDERTKNRRIIGVGITPGHIAYGIGGAWALDPDAERVIRIRPNGFVGAPVSVSYPGRGPPATLAVGEGAVWIAYRDVPEVARLDKGTGQLRTGLGGGGRGALFYNSGDATIEVGQGAVWFTNRSDEQYGSNHSGRITELDPLDGSVRARIFVGGVPRSLAVGPDAVWVADDSGFWRIDPRNEVPLLHIGMLDAPLAIATADDAVWVATRNRTLRRVDPRTNKVVATIRLPYTPYDVAATGSGVWVSVGIRD
jgi:DNA-binding beta-propeller fold protein YncE